MRITISKRYIIGFIFNIGCISASAQSPLAIGDECPDITFENVLNYPSSALRLSDYKGKLLILDFWGTGCSSCIAAFPRMEALQDKFKDQIQVLLINKESPDSTKKFFASKRRLKIPGLPMIMGDSVLHRLFPHVFVPHHVWLDNSRNVKYITDNHSATVEKVSAFLAGNAPVINVKHDVIMSDDTPLITYAGGKYLKLAEYYSYIAHCASGVDIGNTTTSTVGANEVNHITRNCASAKSLIVDAFGEAGGKYDFSAVNTVILDVMDTSKFVNPVEEKDWEKWFKNYSYYYELRVPPAFADRTFQFMQQQMTAFFNVDVKIEKRKIKCLVLEHTGSNKVLKTKGGKPGTNFWIKTTDSIAYLRNLPFDSFVSNLRVRYNFENMPVPVPFIDATNYSDNVDLEIKAMEGFDLVQLQNDLKKYNLSLTVKDWPTYVLIIKEKNYASTSRVKR